MTTVGAQRTVELIAAAQRGDRDAANALISENERLVWSIVRRFFNRGTESEDLFQLGCIGLLKAVQGFDASYGTQFSTYAVPKIAGEIRRFLRDDGMVKLSRSTKEAAFEVRRTRKELSDKLDRDPTISEIAEMMGLPPEEVASLECAVAPVDSLQRENGENGLTLESCIGESGMEEGVVDKIALREVVTGLPKRERDVIVLRYFHGLTQQQTAKITGVSQVQVSRIERKAIDLLRKTMVEI